MLLMHAARMPVYLAFAKAGSNMAAKMAMMAMTTSNSISVKPDFRGFPKARGIRFGI
jgi:hypothetical protein